MPEPLPDQPVERAADSVDSVESTDQPKKSRRASDRRGTDRRAGLDRRRGPGRRRGEVRKDAEEGEMSGELLEFVITIDEYKRINERPFPSWSEVFEIVHFLGYRRVAERAEHINMPRGGKS
ncbi:MAG: hypothetical protein HOP29_01125 [Phycisphaerales bacterium]|nr:hypothetical protein [Phycisphaerales bacterium]